MILKSGVNNKDSMQVNGINTYKSSHVCTGRYSCSCWLAISQLYTMIQLHFEIMWTRGGRTRFKRLQLIKIPLCILLNKQTCILEVTDYFAFKSEILLFPASTIVLRVISCTGMNIMSHHITSAFNQDSHYKYNCARINYIKLSSRIYRNVWKSQYKQIPHVIMSYLHCMCTAHWMLTQLHSQLNR